MTDQASASGRAGRTRRQLLAGGTGALVAVLAAEALARPAPAYAGTDGDVVLGQTNDEITQTSIQDNTAGDTALSCSAAGSGTGLLALSDTGDAIQGQTNSGFGVRGDTFGGLAAVFGRGAGDGNGVFGLVRNSGASGVYGQNNGNGYGTAGRADTGVGTLGDSAYGVGVWASSAHATALRVTGQVQFSRSGVAAVAGTSRAPKNSVRVRLPVTGHSMMTALLQKHVAGVWVTAAVANPRGGYFTIYLNKAVRTRVGPIAWMVTEHP